MPITLRAYGSLYVNVFVCFPVSQNMKRTGYFTDTQRKAQKSVRRRFLLIVFVFALW